MVKITFMGAGSTVFAKNVLGDCMVTPSLKGIEIALYDIDEGRLNDSLLMLQAINRCHKAKAKIKTFLGVKNRKKALAGADFVVNAIQVGGYDPCTITDFEIPKKFGLKQTIADTLGIGGIFRALRTIPVVIDFLHDMEEVCPNALFINYTNPMSMITGAALRASSIKTIGLCHSVQACAGTVLHGVGLDHLNDGKVSYKIAGINHQGWLLELKHDGVDIYDEVRKRSLEGNIPDDDRVRHEIMRRFGYYITESSEHTSEYTPYFIKNAYPELIERFNIPLDEYPRRCIHQIEEWKQRRTELTTEPKLHHDRTGEYASHIVEAMVNNKPFKLGGNVLNTAGLISNLPREACVEVPCLVDASGIQPIHIGNLPVQCAALNRTNINPQLLTIEAAFTRKKEYIYQAAMLDPHTSAELSIDDIVAMCDEMIVAHEGWMPKFN